MAVQPAYELRRVELDAAEQLSQLGAKSFQQAYADTHSTEHLAAYCGKHYSVEKIQSILGSKRAAYCVAYREADPVGFYVLLNQSSPAGFPKLTCELKQIYVLASEYGCGLGQLLYWDAIASAAEFGVDTIWLCVSTINYRAQAFYRKLGFVELGAGPLLEVGRENLCSRILSVRI
ncbi:MAG: GNAT family N-acetyltransferase [Cyanobacteria bacterium P01_D01_bin.123]